MDGSVSRVHVGALLEELTAIRDEIVGDPANAQWHAGDVHANYAESAQNLLHYLSLRRHDLRPLQRKLAALGVSSLGRAESHVLATVNAVLSVLQEMHARPSSEQAAVVDFARGERLLAEHTEALLGAAAHGRDVRIMVTMPSEAADDYTLVHDLVQQGMDCMRINCAHDAPPAWLRMIEHLRRAESALGKHCRIMMDLAGPKLRTGPIQPGPEVVRIRPRRDPYGRVRAPARIWLTAQNDPRDAPSPADVRLPVPEPWLKTLRTGDKVRFRDARDARRALTVVDVSEDGCWAEATQTAYVVPGTVLRLKRRSGNASRGKATVGSLPAKESVIDLQRGDVLVVRRDRTPGRPASRDAAGQILTPAMIGCTIPEIFDDIRSGNAIWFDDGKIGGVVERVESSRATVRITHARLRGAKLRGDKGINLPDSELRLAALTPKDIEDLSFVAQHADVVALSFANTALDVETLQRHIARLGKQPGIVLKIETRRGFDNLPAMLLQAMRTPHCGVMIARGDLAVECGFERLAEVQEEILWICEAAHVPVIWATQVLETLAKEGMPSRAEITDAAMGHRAECVMLSKGPHVLGAVRALDDILRRMQAHQAKKRAMLRELHLAHALPNEADG